SPDGALGHRAVDGRLDRRQDVLLAYRAALEVTQRAVIALTDDWVERRGRHTDIRVLAHRVLHQPIGDDPNIQRTGQRDRALDDAQLVDLSQPDALPVAVHHEGRGGHLFPELVAVMRQDDRHTGAERPRTPAHFTLTRHHRRLPDGDTRHISDRIVRPRRQRSQPQPNIPRPWPRRRRHCSPIHPSPPSTPTPASLPRIYPHAA